MPILRGEEEAREGEIAMKASAPECGHEVAGERAKLVERVMRKLDKYLPESGELRSWTISEIEESLFADMTEIACGIIESRLRVDPMRQPSQKPLCPKCQRALAGMHVRSTHKKTIVGPVRYERTVGYCQACGLAFSPSGHGVEVRRGLL
jgi:hypothetical protein